MTKTALELEWFSEKLSKREVEYSIMLSLIPHLGQVDND